MFHHDHLIGLLNDIILGHDLLGGRRLGPMLRPGDYLRRTEEYSQKTHMRLRLILNLLKSLILPQF